MLRVFASLLIAVVAVLGLAPGLPAATPALAQEMGGMMGMGGMSGMSGMGMSGMGMGMSGMSGMSGMGGMTGHSRTGSSSGTTRGCGSGQQNVSAGAISGLPRVTIGIQDGSFLPDQLTVPAGTRVRWVNNGDRPHTSTAWNRWDSGVLMPGQSCEAWFVTPGTYEYLSIVAADGGTMHGTITVQGSLSDMSGPSMSDPAMSSGMMGSGN